MPGPRVVGVLVAALGCAGFVLLPQTARPVALTAESIAFNATVTFDSFDSGDTNYSTGGLYDAAKSKDNGDVLTTGAGFSLGGHSWIMGHVRTGPGGNVSIISQGSIGSKSWVQGGNRGIQPGWFTNDWAMVWPEEAPPGGISWSPAVPGSYTINGTNYEYAFFSSGNFSVTSLTGNVYIGTNAHVRLLVTGSANLSGVDIAPQDASLDMYVSASYISLGGAMNGGTSQKVANLRLFGLPTCLSISLVSGAQFTGMIFAPQADLQIGSAVLVGAIFAKSATVSGTLAFHYDEQLGLPQPSIHSQPQSQTVLAGQDAHFSVSATGQRPLGLQWRFNGNPIAGETDGRLIITNVGARHAGTYSVVVANAWGSDTSSNAILTVIGNPPSILGQPVSQAVLPGSNAVLRVSAASSEPLTYQWEFNGSDVPAATNSCLALSGMQPANVGTYSVVVTDAFGSATSSNAVLSLATPPDFLWARGASVGAYGPSSGSYLGSSMLRAIAADALGNVFVAGSSDAATLDLGGAVLTNSVPTNGLPGPRMQFICQYDAWGNVLWCSQAGTNNGQFPAPPPAIGTDGFGNAYLAGHFEGTASFGSNTLVSVGPADMFVVKYDPQGQVLWARRIGAVDPIFWKPFGFAVDAAGNAYVASRDSGTADFGSVTLTNSAAFLAKYDPAGTLLWAAEALAVEAIAAGTNGAVYVAGGGGILAKYEEAGNLAWSRAFPYGQAIALDAQENIFVTGYGLGTYDGLTITNSGGAADFFVARCTPAGQLLWLRQAGGIKQERGTSIALDSLDNVYVAGSSGTAYAEPRLAFGPTVLTNVMTFVVKYDSAGNALWGAAPASTNRVGIFGIAVADPADVYVVGNFAASSGSFAGPDSYSVSFGSFVLQNPGSSQFELFAAKLVGVEPAGPPVITGQPQGQLSAAGGSVTLAATVPSGIPLACQWSLNGASVIPGATNLSLTLPTVQLADGGDYSLVVSNAYGATTSAPVTLTVISVQPEHLKVFAGQEAQFSLVANPPAPLVAQWQFGGANILDATGDTLLLNAVTSAQAGNYVVTATDIVGQVASVAAILEVGDPPAAVLASPRCAGGGQFQFSVTGAPSLAYVVEASTDLIRWDALATNTPPFVFVDHITTNCPQRFYRAICRP